MTMYIFRGHQKKIFGTSVLNIVRSKGMILDKGMMNINRMILYYSQVKIKWKKFSIVPVYASTSYF